MANNNSATLWHQDVVQKVIELSKPKFKLVVISGASGSGKTITMEEIENRLNATTPDATYLYLGEMEGITKTRLDSAKTPPRIMLCGDYDTFDQVKKMLEDIREGFTVHIPAILMMHKCNTMDGIYSAIKAGLFDNHIMLIVGTFSEPEFQYEHEYHFNLEKPK